MRAWPRGLLFFFNFLLSAKMLLQGRCSTWNISENRALILRGLRVPKWEKADFWSFVYTKCIYKVGSRYIGEGLRKGSLECRAFDCYGDADRGRPWVAMGSGVGCMMLFGVASEVRRRFLPLHAKADSSLRSE